MRAPTRMQAQRGPETAGNPGLAASGKSLLILWSNGGKVLPVRVIGGEGEAAKALEMGSLDEKYQKNIGVIQMVKSISPGKMHVVNFPG